MDIKLPDDFKEKHSKESFVRDISPEDMIYRSPISIVQEITSQFKEQVDNQVFEAVLNVGVNVDKTELLKALNYDRNQFEEGYSKGRESVIVPLKKLLMDNKYYIPINVINQILVLIS